MDQEQRRDAAVSTTPTDPAAADPATGVAAAGTTTPPPGGSTAVATGGVPRWRMPILGPVPAPIIAPAGMVLLLLLVVALFAPEFYIWGNVRTVILDASIYFILGVGMTFVITSRGIDLSIGAIVVLSGVAMAAAIQDFGAPVAVGMLLALAIGAACGLVNGVIIQKLRLPDLIVTLANELIFRGLALIYAGGAVYFGFPEVIRFLGGGRIAGIPMPIILGLATVVIAHLMLTYHRYGYRLHAVGGDPVAARRMGLRVDRYRIGVYVLMGVLCGFVAIILAGRLDSVVASGAMTLMLHTIAAVIVGGTNLFGGRGTIIGTLLGALLLSAIANMVVLLGFESFWQHVAAGIVIITSIALYSGRARQREAK